MAVIRKNNETGYVKIANETARDSDLSLSATGLLVQLLSHNDGFKISVESIVRSRSKNGKTSIINALTELREAGYVHFIGRVKDDEGQWAGSIWDIFEIPHEKDPSLNQQKSGQKSIVDHSAVHEALVHEGAVNESILEDQVKNNHLRIPTKGQSDSLNRNENPIWDAVVYVCGIDPKQLTGSARGQIGKAVKEIRESLTDVREIYDKADMWRILFPGATLTPTALAKHWPALTIEAVERLTTTKQRDRALNEVREEEASERKTFEFMLAKGYIDEYGNPVERKELL